MNQTLTIIVAVSGITLAGVGGSHWYSHDNISMLRDADTALETGIITLH